MDQRRGDRAELVYPRECGGTSTRVLCSAMRWGLSPRVRGNRRPCRRAPLAAGSIPASAGEPGARRDGRRRARVYPRECGGTSASMVGMAPPPGLSPRVRGNQSMAARAMSLHRSIPASAGEPPSLLRTLAASGVYPRECGGTRQLGRAPGLGPGLSPRVRGNRGRHLCAGRRAGSIPASAGEPRTTAIPASLNTVYPRECGGTTLVLSYGRPAMGLSPRVRGNQAAMLVHVVAARSIPASAGEPGGY